MLAKLPRRPALSLQGTTVQVPLWDRNATPELPFRDSGEKRAPGCDSLRLTQSSPELNNRIN
jgi:hypothetical protein